MPRHIRLFVLLALLNFLWLEATPAQVPPPGPEVFQARRDTVMARIGHGLLIMFSNPVAHRNGDVDYPFRQDSDFHYLTGLDEPRSVLVLRPGHASRKFVLFVRERDPQREKWTGRRFGTEGAMKYFGADTAYTIDQFDEKIGGMLWRAKELYMPLGVNEKMEEKVLDRLRALGAHGAKSIHSPAPVLGEMRLIKSEQELKLLRRAIDITCDAHRAAMRSVRPGMFEYQAQAVIEGVFMREGAARVGFPSIVGSGPNTTTLHYETNRRQTQKGELMLMDIGAEYEYYTADVTRTIPVNGKFNEEQKAIYNVVLDAQKAAMETVKPGVPLIDVFKAADRAVAEGLVDLGLLEGDVEELVKARKHKKFFWHSLSHWLGMDVHDAGRMRVNGAWRNMVPGMVFTIEPGIYIPADTEGVDERWWNIGVRIEDDVLVTADGYENLSAAAPVTVKEIEKHMKR